MTIKEYYVELNNHDWMYEMSDDFTAWRNGKTRQNKLKEIAKTDPALQELYDGFEAWTNGIISGNKIPKPECPKE